MRAYIGIDPGKHGFISVICGDLIESYPIPLIKGELDILGLDDIFKTIKSFSSDTYCVIEHVHAIFGSSAKATFGFGYVAGVLEALLVANKISYTKVQPKQWQKQMWEGIPVITKQGSNRKDTKAMSLLAGQRIFPQVDLRATERSKKPHDGKVDALLLMEYGRRNY